jgi:hypothetical protein
MDRLKAITRTMKHDKEDPKQRSGKTYFASDNKDTGVSFRCTLPSGSKHARDALDITARTQDLQLETQAHSSRRLGDKIYSQRRKITDDSAVSGHSTSDSAAMESDVRLKMTPEIKREGKIGTKETDIETRRAGSETLQFQKQETRDEVVYYGKMASREVFVSAPQGSVEARVYDEFAARVAHVSILRQSCIRC